MEYIIGFNVVSANYSFLNFSFKIVSGNDHETMNYIKKIKKNQSSFILVMVVVFEEMPYVFVLFCNSIF